MSLINIDEFIKNYWNYYIELENQLLQTKKYVEFNKSNYKTFSIEYLKLLQATCSEIDVVSKIIAEDYDENFKKLDNKNIQVWGLYLHKVFPDIEEIAVTFLNEGTIIPWKNWDYETFYDKSGRFRYRLKKDKETPVWWTAYNKVKHERIFPYGEGKTNYSRANLENLILAMSALFILETLFIEKMTETQELPNVFQSSKLFEIVR